MPAKPGLRERLITITCWASVDFDDRHAGDGAVGVVFRRRIGDVVGADDDRDVGARHLRIDLLHLAQLLVGDVGLGQQYVHVAGHAAGDGVDRVADGDAALLQLVGDLLDRVLGLGDGEAVAGDDHDRVGVGELDRGVLGADRGVGSLLPVALAAGRARRRSQRRGCCRPSGSSRWPSPSSGSFPRSRPGCRRRSARRCRGRSRRRRRRGR